MAELVDVVLGLPMEACLAHEVWAHFGSNDLIGAPRGAVREHLPQDMLPATRYVGSATKRLAHEPPTRGMIRHAAGHPAPIVSWAGPRLAFPRECEPWHAQGRDGDITSPSKLTIIPSPIESNVPSDPHMHTLQLTSKFWKLRATRR